MFFLDSVCVSHVTNMIGQKNVSRDQLVSATKIIKKKREREHNMETMGVAGRGR